jgi:hypothetical protein
MSTARDLRKQFVDVALEWEKHFGVAPSITSAISELGAARLVGMSEAADCAGGTHRTAVTKDTDLVCGEVRYQVTASRPSGKRGSKVRLVSHKTEKKRPFGWDRLIWIRYDRFYRIQEVREFTADEYEESSVFVRPLADDMRKGRPILFSMDD